MTIKHLAYRIGHEFPGAVAGLASLMNKGEGVLRNKLNPNSETHFLTIQEFETMTDFAERNPDVAKYFSAKAGGVFVKFPNIPESDMGMLDLFLSATKEFADISSAFQSAYADGRIDNKDFAKISKEFDESIAKIIELKSGIERIVR